MITSYTNYLCSLAHFLVKYYKWIVNYYTPKIN